jgi:hypothetical protein
MEVADKYRNEHIDDDWLGYTENAAGCLRAAFGSSIPQLPIRHLNEGQPAKDVDEDPDDDSRQTRDLFKGML